MNKADQVIKSSFLELINFADLRPEHQYKANLAEEQVPEAENWTSSELVTLTHSSQEIAPAQALASLTPSKLVYLIQKMHSSNSSLLNRVLQLEQALVESQSDLQPHKQRSQITESSLTQPTQEPETTQEQIKFLVNELETSRQTVERQQILIETLTAQLASSQERVAQMERECSCTQAQYNEQSHQLSQAENTCRELRTRLTREQRHSIQLKVALEQCLEVSVPSYQAEVESDRIFTNDTNQSTIDSVQSQSLFPKAQPIQPWSVPPQSFTNQLQSTWSEAAVIPQSSTFDWNCSINLAAESRTSESEWALDPNLSTDVPTPIASEGNDEVFPCLESQEVLRELVFEAPRIDLPKIKTDSAKINSFVNDLPQPENYDWQDLFSQLAAEEQPSSTHSTEKLLTTPNTCVQLDEQLNESSFGANQVSETNTEDLQFQFSSSQVETNFSSANSNWLSPVVYPSHTAKSKKSLAAIELPNFTQKRVRNE